MKTQKMSLSNLQGKLNRTEMKNVLGGALVGIVVVQGSPSCINSKLNKCYANGTLCVSSITKNGKCKNCQCLPG